MTTTRRSLLTATSAAAAGSLLSGTSAHAKTATEPASAVHRDFPSQDPTVVRELVSAAHARLERVQEILAGQPELANAAYDWGYGDWETALGAASHMGRRDIAKLLLENGARPDIFSAAMLGNLPAVKAFVAARPGIQRHKGPHGITLLAHARSGGKEAEGVLKYLEQLGDADIPYTDLPLSDEQKQAYVGTYRFGEAPGDELEMLINRRGSLAVKRGDDFARMLLHLGDHEFHPGGAPSARFRFDVAGGQVRGFELLNPHTVLTARRAPKK